MRLILITFTLAATMLALSSCNTVEGAGKDIEKGGKKIQKAAK